MAIPSRRPSFTLSLLACLALVPVTSAGDAPTNRPPPGFTALFDGKDLTGWKGLVGDPLKRAKMSAAELKAAQGKADADVPKFWKVEDGQIVNLTGKGPHLCTTKDYGDFEMWVDWKIAPGTDSGIYLRGSPQVQIWDPVAGIPAAKVGSGGLYNNKKGPAGPLVKADKPTGEWNTFHIKMIGERVTVKLNGQLVVDDQVLENYWDRKRPIFPKGQIELQTHNGELRFRNIFVREIPPAEANSEMMKPAAGFVEAFNGRDLTGWIGATSDYEVRGGTIACKPKRGGTLYMKDEYADFTIRFEFLVPPGGNNGLAIRAPLTGNPAHVGMEIQVLDDDDPKYANLKNWQYHGSVYGVIPAHRGYTRPAGEWNSETVVARGSHVTVTVNGTTVVDGDVEAAVLPTDSGDHSGVHRKSGYVGFFGHGDPVEFRNVWIKSESLAAGAVAGDGKAASEPVQPKP